MADETGGWKFSQCFGDKGNTTEVSEGACAPRNALDRTAPTS